jgi:transposase-like protein
MMRERGVFVDHATVHRWAIKMVPVLAAVFRRRKHPVGKSWRMDETYIKVAGQWKYLYRVVDRAGDTVDFLLTAKRDIAAARRFLERAINLHDLPEKITIDQIGANTAAIESVKAVACVDILMRQKQIPQQHRRTGPPGQQADHPADAGLQVILECPHSHRRHRNHAHDSQGADGLPRWPNHVRSAAVLQPGSLITRSATQLFSAKLH